MEVNLLKRYPKTDRSGIVRTEADRRVAREFGEEFFDGDRTHGYGGYHYDPKYWRGVAEDIRDYYGLTKDSRVLDVGCAKGFFMKDLKDVVGCTVRGIDISWYAIDNAHPDVRADVVQGDCRFLPFPTKAFDLAVSINTIHNLEGGDLEDALIEIRLVSQMAYVVVDAYRTAEQRKRLEEWNLTAQTILHVEGWKCLFDECGYTGDYWWFTP